NKSIDNLKEKERLDQELKIARNVQLSLLPEKLPEAENYQFVSKLETAAEVGGDLYDVIKLEDNKFLFTIGDVSGKGTSAAFYMAQFLSLLRYSAQFTDKPVEIAYRINEYFAKEVKTKQVFITAVIGVIDTEKNEMNYVRAGHCLPVFIQNKNPEKYQEINSSGLGIGLTGSTKQFQNLTKVKKILLEKGDKMIFYTDGIVEALYPDKSDKKQNVMYGEERLKKLILNSATDKAEIITDKIIDDLKNFYGKNSPYDDYTILIIQRNN
ncbi:MAG: PP2C family protein-serine/threonine phosphatase, partial [Calditrichia bacterium]|nr:PP2C family protein-serine/threonine phosphatase [Calditrichia bacterium]